MTIDSSAQSTAGSLRIPASAAGERAGVRRFSFNRRMRGIIFRQIFLQLFLLFMLMTVMFPVLWIISMAVDPRGVARPTDLNLLPANANLMAFQRLLSEPFSNTFPVYFGQLLMNSLFIALGVSVFTVLLGASAAYAFSRFRFVGREAGMLTFIVLLLLPSTGVIIPLYVMFNSVALSSSVAEFFPSLFAGLLVGGGLALMYAIIRSLGKFNPDRSLNLPPYAITLIVAALSLAAMLLAMNVMFVRHPLYSETVSTPLRTLQDTLSTAQQDVRRLQQSVEQRSSTAARREQRAAEAAQTTEAAQSLLNSGRAMTTDGDMRALLSGVITFRQGRQSDQDAFVLAAASAALDLLTTDGPQAAIASLEASVEQARAAEADLLTAAQSARANADEASVNLRTASDALAAASADLDANAPQYYAVHNTIIVQTLPIVLIAWAAALGASALVWLAVRALRPVVEPQRAVLILLVAVAGALIAAFTISTLQYRLTLVRSDTQTLRTTLLGLALAFSSGGLPFAIWNLKGYFDTIPKELEEAALIDGAGRIATFIRIMVPLALPAFAIVILFSFMNGWTEFILSWIFLTGQQQNYTLAMSLATLTGGANQPPPDMQKFAALAILISLPILVLFFSFQRFIVGGLSLGGVKG
jgi:arabinogalactan oligomer/maltooligosaccharide transport system permease protein